MPNEYTAIIRRDGQWWIGWLQEIPGVNGQASTREALIEDLQSALREMLELNREKALEAVADDDFEEIRISA